MLRLRSIPLRYLFQIAAHSAFGFALTWAVVFSALALLGSLL